MHKVYFNILFVLLCLFIIGGCTKINNQKENKKETVNNGREKIIGRQLRTRLIF